MLMSSKGRKRRADILPGRQRECSRRVWTTGAQIESEPVSRRRLAIRRGSVVQIARWFP